MIHNIIRLLRTVHSAVRHRRELAKFLSFCNRTKPGLEGSVQPEEFVLLEELVRVANQLEGPIVEIGTLFGFTTQAMACWKKADKDLITIDDYSWNPLGLLPRAHRDFTRRSLHYLMEQCQTTLFEGLSSDFCTSYKGPAPSLIFIDASHIYEHVLADIKWAKSVGVPIIAGHDYSKFWPGVKQAVDESFGTDIKVKGTLWASISSAKS